MSVMQRVVIAVPSYRGLGFETAKQLSALVDAGAVLQVVYGCSDVAWARNMVLTSAIDNHPDRKCVLCIDDDMVFGLELATDLCDAVLATGIPHAAAYPTAHQSMAGTRYHDTPDRWAMGLGFAGIPMAQLIELGNRTGRIDGPNRSAYPFCECRVWGGRWSADDFTLSRKLGGFRVKHRVGHRKEWPLWLDSQSYANVLRPNVECPPKPGDTSLLLAVDE